MHQFPYLSRFYALKICKLVFILLPFLILLIWFFIKVFQFQSDVSFVDALIALQISKGWIDGRPLLFETYNGYHNTFHNYYIMPIIGLITWFTGIYGLFIVYLSLLSLLLFKLISWSKKNVTNWYNAWLAILIFAIGPFAFLVFIDRFGWHPEQYFLPLMGLLSFYLARRKWLLVAILVVFVASVKETSPVLLCGFLLFASTTDGLLENPNHSWFSTLLQRRNMIIVSVCIVFFALGMLLLSFLSGSESSRLSQAFVMLYRHLFSARFLVYITETIAAIALLYLIAILPFIPLLRVVSKGYLLAIILFGYLVVLGGIFFIEGLLYYPSFQGNLPYPTRIGSAWGFFLSCYIYLLIRTKSHGISLAQESREWSLYSCILQLVFGFFLISDDWNPDIYKSGKGGLVFHFVKSGLGLDPYMDPDWRLLHSIAKKLPKNAEVLAPDRYLSIFQRVYGVGWHHYNLVLGRPLLLVYEKTSLKTDTNYYFPKEGYETIPNDNLLILIDSKWKNLALK